MSEGSLSAPSGSDVPEANVLEVNRERDNIDRNPVTEGSLITAPSGSDVPEANMPEADRERDNIDRNSVTAESLTAPNGNSYGNERFADTDTEGFSNNSSSSYEGNNTPHAPKDQQQGFFKIRDWLPANFLGDSSKPSA